MEKYEITPQPQNNGNDLWRNIKSVHKKVKGTKLTNMVKPTHEQLMLPDDIIVGERFAVDPNTGLTTDQVQKRIEEGAVNLAVDSPSKSRKEIIYSNIFTYFNLIFFIIAVLLILVGSFRDLTFLPVIIANTLIGIVQELRSKKVLDNLRLLNAPKNTVIRDGKTEMVPAEELVLDDMIILSAGNQIPADVTVELGEVLVNESLLTGESDQIIKKQGEMLLSGSFIAAGECHARVERVGKDSYISQLTLQAKAMNDDEESEMIRSLDRLVKCIGILIIPIAIILFSQQYFINHSSIRASVTATVAAIVGMIPEGLYLLASVALVVSVMRLATQKVLVHNMKCIETLARVDILCVDKTGTITDNTMTVKVMFPLRNLAAQSEGTSVEQTSSAMEAADDSIIQIKSEQCFDDCLETDTEMERGFDDISDEDADTLTDEIVYKNEEYDLSEPEAFSAEETAELELAIGDFAAAMATDNITMKAIKDHFRKRSGKRPEKVFPFSSVTKFSGAVFEDVSYVLGAPEYILKDTYSLYAEIIEQWSYKGFRVLIFARYPGELSSEPLTMAGEPMGMILLANPVRENAKETFSYFANQGVEIKVISGDNPITVSEVAKEAGITGAENFVDASTLTDRQAVWEAATQYTVFGRVSPDQKKELVSALKAKGHTVAMTGDGVNDILALKDADCSIAMASGSDAATQVAQLVLLESDFSRMPSVVAEGRRVVNNIERTASLFLVKNIFSLFLSILSIVLMVNYPFEPSQISLISMFTIGIPAFVMSQERNTDHIEGHFLSNVLFKALPGGLTDFLVVSGLYLFCLEFDLTAKDVSTSCTVVLGIVGLMILYRIASPMTKTHWILWFGMAAGLIYCMVFVSSIFGITSISKKCMMLLIIFAIITEPTFRYLTGGIKRLSAMYLKWKDQSGTAV